jgi:hypothetical protein
MAQARSSILAATIAVLSACSPASDSPTQSIEQWKLEPVLTIGGTDSGPASFTWVTSVDADREGRILVLDQEAQRIDLFDSAGTHLRSIGRKGKGPGEFQEANGFRLAPDGAIWVNNPNNDRISIFGADGNLTREIPLRINSYSIREWNAWFDGETLQEEIDERIDTLYVDRIRSFRQDGSRIDTLPMPCEGLIPRPTRDNVLVIQHSRGTTGIPIPWKPAAIRVFDGRGHAWCGVSDHYLLRRLDLAGGDTLILRGSRTPSPVTARDRDSMIDLLRRHALSKLDLPDPDWSRIPAAKPIIGQVRIDDAGRVWVQVAIDGPVQRWEVYSSGGTPIAEVSSPVALHARGPLSIRGDLVYGVTMDPDDVVRVVKARILRQ